MGEIKKWDEVDGVVKADDSLKHAEMLLEDDYDQIDGIINNGSRKEIEEERNSIKESIKQQQENFEKELKAKDKKKDYLCPERDLC